LRSINAIFAIIGWLIIVFTIALICKNQFPRKKELTRKIIHIGTGPIIPIAWWYEIPKNLAFSIASMITIALVLNYQFRLLDSIENISRKSYGTIAYGISITLLILLFWPQNAEAITAGILVMAFGDGLAGVIGKEFKSKTWKVLGQTKSIAGTCSMYAMSMLVLYGISIFTGTIVSPLEIIFVASLATGLEQISIWGLDNLTVPFGVVLTWISITNI
tara:strand:- start:5229 stop:5882 length:654 start_codon:yes stop_codon:yes gene_type:complete